MVTVAVYGSLKRGYYNHVDHFFKRAKYLKTADAKGFEMYDLGFFPAIVPVDDKTKKVVVELYDVPYQSYKDMRKMELGAGYREIERNISGYRCRLWVYDKNPAGAKLIPSGNWEEPDWNDMYDDIETIYLPDDDEDLDRQLKELLREYPHLKDDPEIVEYLKNNPEFMDELEDDDYEIDDDWLQELDDEIEQEFIKAIDLDTDSSKPKYPLDPTYMCACEQMGEKSSWEWDDVHKHWHCIGCGDTQ